METVIGRVPVVSAQLTPADFWGTVKARIGVGRMKYLVDPGLYALGSPGPESEVLVTGNYKMSLDRLRRNLHGRDFWILVLDTDGINVWCAAGKGTFGTDELVGRIESSRLSELFSHRRLVLPQLAAPGVAAHDVKKRSGFRVIYGPVRAEDLPKFLDSGMQATSEMRRKEFPLRERLVLIPLEFIDAGKIALLLIPIVFLLAGLGGPGSYWSNALYYGSFAVIALVAAIVAGAVVTPALLPWIPGRAFSLKGGIVGLAAAVILAAARSVYWAGPANPLEIAAWMLLVPAISAYCAMNFTGASTYTSLSGVRKEMRLAVPLQIAAAAVGLALWIGSRLTA